jgi:hypothetical protein
MAAVGVVITAAVVSTGIADAIRIFLFAGIINSKKTASIFGGRLLFKN